ncbi:MAG: hypothetical protein ABSB30_06465 [Terracidiphilus sp.]|jgi:tetratricopeptide (TPR) repeat protein
MKVRLGLPGFFFFLFFTIIPPLAAQQPKPSVPHPPAPDAAERKQLAALLVEFHSDPNNVELRGQIIDLAKTLKPAPLTPQLARADFVKATARLKAASAAEDFKEAAGAFERVALQAPWYADAYLNAATAYAKGGDYDNAERNLALYMSAVRLGVDTRAAESLQKEIDQQQTRQRFQQALQDYQSHPSESARAGIAKLASRMQPPPEIPNDARDHYTKAKALAESARNLDDYNQAIAEFNSALLIAPWWTDPARELAAAQASAQQLQFQSAISRLRYITRYSNEDQSTRQKIIQAVLDLPAPPPIPEDAVRYMARGEALVKMGGAGSYTSAAREIEKAVLAAPWSADGYFNLGIVQESAGMYKEAIQNLQLYLLAAPRAANAHTVQTKIYELEVMVEDQEKTKTLAGTWKTAHEHTFHVSVDGNKIRIEMEPYWIEHEKLYLTLDLIKKGMTLEGTLTESLETDVTCSIPSQTNPATGVIGEDFRSIKVKYRETGYDIRWMNDPRTGKAVSCSGVNSVGENESGFELVTRLGP